MLLLNWIKLIRDHVVVEVDQTDLVNMFLLKWMKLIRDHVVVEVG